MTSLDLSIRLVRPYDVYNRSLHELASYIVRIGNGRFIAPGMTLRDRRFNAEIVGAMVKHIAPRTEVLLVSRHVVTSGSCSVFLRYDTGDAVRGWHVSQAAGLGAPARFEGFPVTTVNLMSSEDRAVYVSRVILPSQGDDSPIRRVVKLRHGFVALPKHYSDHISAISSAVEKSFVLGGEGEIRSHES